MVGVPGRQIGWMSRFGERLRLPPHGSGKAIGPHTGDRHVLADGVCRLVDSSSGD
jgi:UDP-2-acetamido-3-amino-2,3-dideoxy-glucuronate N-acetyltransferase